MVLDLQAHKFILFTECVTVEHGKFKKPTRPSSSMPHHPLDFLPPDKDALIASLQQHLEFKDVIIRIQQTEIDSLRRQVGFFLAEQKKSQHE